MQKAAKILKQARSRAARKRKENEEFWAKLKLSMQQVKEGKYVIVRTQEELKQFLDSL